MKSGKKVSLIMQILIAMVLGVIVGVIWGKGASCIQFIGTVWLNIIKMFIVPVVICMVVRGVSSLDSPKALGRIGLRVVAFYVITNVFALGIGILTTFVLKPGIGFVFEAMTTETVDSIILCYWPLFYQYFCYIQFRRYAPVSCDCAAYRCRNCFHGRKGKTGSRLVF